MKKTLYTLALFFFLVSVSHAETLKMGYFMLKPHLYKTGDKADGAAVAWFENAAKSMGYSVAWEGPLPFPRLVKYLQEGKLDGTLMFSKNEKRTTFLYYTEPSYFPVQSVFLVKKDNPINEIKSVEDVKNFRIGFMKGANFSGFIKNNMDNFNIQLISGSNWVEQNIGKVLRNRLDAAYDLNQVTLPYEAARMGVSGQVKILPLPENPMYVYVVFSKKTPRGKEYLMKFNGMFDQFKPYDEFIKMELNKVVKK